MANKSLAAAQKAYAKGRRARQAAAKKGVVTSQRPQKKKKREVEQPKQIQPKTTSMSRPKVQKASAPKAMQTATTTDMSSRHNQFKKSATPKITNTSKAAKKPTALESARKAYEKGKNRTYLGTEQKKTTTKVGKNGKLESVNALTRSEFNRMTEASRYGKKMGNQLLKGGKRTGQKDIREKVGSKTAESAYKSKAATGVMQGMSYADVFSNSVGTYNKQAKKAIKKTKESTAYNVGYGVGMAGDMMLTGVAGRGAALARSAEKAGAKLAARAGKEVAKEAVEQGAKRSVKQSAKKFAANRAGELAAETPTNILDAAKMSMDENGKVDKKQMAKWAVANTALTAGTGGLIEGVGAATTKKLANNTMDLLGKQRAGTITKEESIKLGKNIKKLANKSENAGGAISGDIAGRNIENIKEAAKENRVLKAKEKADVRTVRTANAEAATFRQQADTLKKHLNTVEKKMKAEGTMQGYSRLSAQKEQLQNALQHTEGKIKNAERVATNNNPNQKNRRFSKVTDADISERLNFGSDYKSKSKLRKAYREGKKIILESKREISDFMDKALKNADPDNEISVTYGRVNSDLAERAKKLGKDANGNTYNIDDYYLELNPSDLRHCASNKHVHTEKGELPITEEDIKNLPDIIDDFDHIFSPHSGGRGKRFSIGKKVNGHSVVVMLISDEKGGLHPLNMHKYRTDVYDRKFAAAIKKHQSANAQTYKPETYSQRSSSTLIDASSENNVAQKSGKVNKQQRIDEIDNELQDLHEKQKASKDADEIRELNIQRKSLNEEKKQLLKNNETPNEGGFARFTGEEAEEELNRMFKSSSPNEDKAVVKDTKPKVGGANTAKEVTGEISKTKKLVDSIKRGFFDSFTNLEQIANSIDDVAKRDRFRSLIQNVRMSKGIALSKVADEFIGVYREAGLAKSGAGAKRADFERYCNLKHDLERFDHDTEFLGFDSKEAIQKEIDNLEAKYKDGSLQKFQKGVVKYFDSLLDEDVRSGLDTAENVAKLREDYKNYVPTFRDFDGEMNYPPSDAIHFRNFHEASGGTDHRVLSLYEQAIQKTKTTVKRGAMNDMFQAVAELNGVKVKDLPQGADPIEALQSLTLTFKDGRSHYVQFWENGQAKKLEIPEGVYKGLRQWSGEDKAFFMEWNWLNNRAVQRGNELFKAWITDYSLVFGARNFIRDLETGFFYSPNGMRYARNIPRAVCASLADTKPMQMLLKSNIVSDNFKEYVKTYADLAKAYKNNGGEFAQLVKTTNPEKAIRDVFKKKGVLSAIKEINSTIEMIPRMAEFSAVAEDKAIAEMGIKRADWFKMKPSERRAAMNKALADKDNISEAMYRAKEVTLNFDRSGYIGRWLNSGFVPFFNPAVQGLSKLGRVLAKNNKTSSEFASMLAKFAVIGGGSEVLFNSTIGALEEYQDISDYHKTGNLCIPLSIFNKEFGTDFKKTDFIKIPKAREVAAMQGPINWAFQHMLYHTAGKDERLFDSLKSNAKMWREQIGPVSPLSDNLFYAPVRIAKGKNWYGGYINSFDDEDLIKAGKSYKAADEETSLVAYGISKSLNEGADKLGKMLGLDNDQIMGLKQKVWTPKQFDDLMDSYMGIIYDSTIKNTSAKNHDLTDAIDAVNNGNIVGGLHSTWSILKSPFANAFTLDTVFSNRHKQDAYALKTSVNKELSKLVGQDVSGMSKDEIKESVVKQYGYESPEYKSYLKKNAELTRLNQSFLYPSANYGEMMSSIYLRKDLSNAQKDYWVRDIKKQENALLNGRQEGSKYANADPMKYAYNARTKSGKRVFSNDQVVDMCSYESSSGSNNLKDAYEEYRKTNPQDKNAKKFFNLTLDAREINRASGDSLTFTSWNVAAYAAEGRKQKSGVDYSAAAKAYGVSDDKLREARKYFTVGKGTIDTYKSSHRQVVQGGIDIGKYVGQMESWDIVNSLSSYKTKGEKGRKLLDRAYYAEGYYPLKTMNASRCLFSDKYKGSHWSTEKISSFCEENGFSYKEKDKDGKTIKPNPEKVAAAISKKWGKNRTAEECAAVFEEICPGEPNPFGEIGDYSVKGDTGIQYDSWGHGRRGRRRRHGWGGRGGRGGGDSVAGATKMKTKKVSDVTFASNLDDAYRRKLKKLRESSRKDLSK